MISISQLESLINRPLFYSDEETGNGWYIGVYNIYRSASSDSIILYITDDIKVELSQLDLIRGVEQIFLKIYRTYEGAINNV